MASSNAALAKVEKPSMSDKADSLIASPEKEERDAVAGTAPAPAAADPPANTGQDEVEYPIGVTQTLIVLGDLLGTFPVSHDFVRVSKPPDRLSHANLL